MELRVLKYFLAVAREQSISRAAEVLHLTQPTLSRQLKDLEDELGKQLLIRGNRKVILTEDGMLLRKRAEEIVELSNKTIDEISSDAKDIEGDIVIGSGETDDLRPILRTIKEIQKKYPKIHIHINSGDRNDLLEKLDKGLYDFGIFLYEIDKEKYNYIELPSTIDWGIIARKDSPLANYKEIELSKLKKYPMIISRQMLEDSPKEMFKDYNIIATYNLAFNASLMTDEGLGYALTISKLVNTDKYSSLSFIPVKPAIESKLYIVWKKYQIFNKAAQYFLDILKKKNFK